MAMCKSCDEKDATPRECGLDLCVVCHPWVAASLCRTGDLPRWGAEMLTHDPEILVRTRDAMKEEGLGTDGPPILGDNWLDYFRWLLGDDDEALREIEQHIELRDDAEYIGEDSVEQMAGKLLCLVDEQEESREILVDSHWGDGMVLDPDTVVHRFGGHEVEVSSGSFMVDEIHFKNPETVAELLFDSIQELDERGFDERYQIYHSFELENPVLMGRYSSLGDGWTRFQLPSIPLLREHIWLAAKGEYGRDICNRHRAALLLWAFRYNKEFLSREPVPWGRSFQFLRSVIKPSSDVSLHSNGIDVCGRSGTPWRISAIPGFHGEQFTVSRIGGNDVCVLTREQSRDMPFGDLLSSLVLMLLDDVRTSERVFTLRHHMITDQEGEERDLLA